MKTLAPVKLLIAAGSLLAASAANALITYDTWTTNEGDTGNYILTVFHDTTASEFDFNLTIDPWNAEALGMFVDLGDVDVGDKSTITLLDVSPTGAVILTDTDTTSNVCAGSGCDVNGLDFTLPTPDGEWELVFGLGEPGYEGIQTFSFSIEDFGLTYTDFGIVGMRSQVLCSGEDLLPGDEASCGGSDKSYGSSGTITPDPDPDPDPDNPVPVPGTLLLLGLGLFGLRFARKSAV